MGGLFTYKEEHIEFLREACKTMTWNEVADAFFKEFGVRKRGDNLQGVANRRGIYTGRTGTFQKGQIPFNKGMKGINFGGENGKKTQFKKGHRPVNYRPIGSERFSKDGYIEVKVADPNKWRLKHSVVWEEANGPVPKGYCLIFLDRNKLNVSLDNLQLIKRSQLARLNQNHLLVDNPELNKTALIIAELYGKIGERKKKKRKVN